MPRRHGKKKKNDLGTFRVSVAKTIMIKTLRKRHLQIWILWAMLLPVGIIVAWKAVQRNVTHEILETEQAAVLPVSVDDDIRKGKYFWVLKTNQEKTTYQFVWGISRTYSFSNPYVRSTYLIYCDTDSGRELIGRTGGIETYYYNLPNVSSNTYSITIYDPFKEKTIHSFTIKKSK